MRGFIIKKDFPKVFFEVWENRATAYGAQGLCDLLYILVHSRAYHVNFLQMGYSVYLIRSLIETFVTLLLEGHQKVILEA